MCQYADVLMKIICILAHFQISKLERPRSTMDSIRVSEAPDPSSILGEATKKSSVLLKTFSFIRNELIKTTSQYDKHLQQVKHLPVS
jgi:hypothetical protein